MSNELQKTGSSFENIEQVLMQGNLVSLKPEERLLYYKQVCESIGVNPLTRPFEYITLNGKLTLYATRACTDQLRKINKVSVRIKDRQTLDGLYVVTAEATDASGRVDESIGAVPILNLKGDALANSLMKSETKAKRRATLSICGLGLLDESEIESASNAPIRNTQANITEAVRPQIENTEERRKLIEALEKTMNTGGLEALGKEWTKLTADQRKIVGAEEIGRIKSIPIQEEVAS